MSNLLSLQNSKNQLGIGTNSINVSSDLTIKENVRRYIVCNTNNNSLAVHRTIELEDETTLSTVKTHNISSAKLLYISSNNEISSLALSSSNYLKISNTGGLVLIDVTTPRMTITSSTSGVTDGSTTNNATIVLAFTSNETTTDFVAGDITVTNGTISNFTGSGTTYTATFTPSGEGACTIDIAADTFTDALGNNNIASTQFNWTYDTIAPYLDNPNNIGTTTDTTPTFTFNSDEAGTITSSLSFSTSNSADKRWQFNYI